MRDIHSFIGWADRNTLRMECNFHPLQHMIASLTPQLLNDPFIASKPLMVARTSTIFRSLNFCSYKWMDFSLQKVDSWLQEGHRLTLD